MTMTMLHRARHKNDLAVKENNMKKTIVLLLSIVTVIACMTLPVVAASYKLTYSWMDTYYNGSSMVDKGYADFTRSPKRSDPGNNPETVTMKTWLGGKDSQKRGMRTTTTFILINSCCNSSYPVDHKYVNHVGATCVIK